ncbi:hypothetical protein [Microbulbifer taiwanensis]|uniref:DUF4760 domain-containing protein n=1 Tax=Microbulbifer taiwanensis TaxID=986746 RepID=A0ABW1YS78_9GAMM|nr:hypothetical protein [Microbulbifer taiwanensis]
MKKIKFPSNKELANLQPWVIWVGSIVAASIALGLTYILVTLILVEKNIKISDYVQTLILAVLSGTLIYTWIQHNNYEQTQQSKVFLDKSIELLDKAYTVLVESDSSITNDPLCWITSARLIRRSDDLAKDITFDAHQILYLAEHDYQRHRFSNIFQSGEECLPSIFYLGSSQNAKLTLGEAALISAAYGVESWIPIDAISVIYRFSVFPPNFKDPLKDSDPLTLHAYLRMRWELKNKELSRYLTFRNRFEVKEGKIYYRKDPGGRLKELDAYAIDKEIDELDSLFPYSLHDKPFARNS